MHVFCSHSRDGGSACLFLHNSNGGNACLFLHNRNGGNAYLFLHNRNGGNACLFLHNRNGGNTCFMRFCSPSVCGEGGERRRLNHHGRVSKHLDHAPCSTVTAGPQSPIPTIPLPYPHPDYPYKTMRECANEV